MNMKQIVRNVVGFTERKKPEILTGFGMAGVCLTAWQAYKAGPVAELILDKAKIKIARAREEDNKKEVQKIVLQTTKEMGIALAPTIISGGTTIGCIYGANRSSARRIAALSAAYTLSESAVKDLNEKLVETLGEKKVQSIKESIAGDKLKKEAPVPENQIILTGDGDVLCMDLYSGRYFRSNAQKIGQAINELSSMVQSEMYVSLNDFYELIHIPLIPLGEDLGWNIDNTIRGQLPIHFSAQLTNEHVPCLCVEYDVSVRADFRHLQ